MVIALLLRYDSYHIIHSSYIYHLKCALVFSMLTVSCHHHQNLKSRTFSSPQKETLYTFESPKALILPSPKQLLNLFFVSIDLSIMDIPYKWNLIIRVFFCVCDWLFSLSLIFSGLSMFWYVSVIHFFVVS